MSADMGYGDWEREIPWGYLPNWRGILLTDVAVLVGSTAATVIASKVGRVASRWHHKERSG
jgi:hypothetical protein